MAIIKGMNKQSAAVLMVMGSALSLQFGAAIGTQLFPLNGPWAVTSLRLFIAGLIMCLVIRPRLRSWTKKQWIAVLLLGLSLGGMNSLFYASIELIPLGTAVTIEFLGPLIFSAVLARTLKNGLCVALAFLGMALLGIDSLSGETLDPLGVIFAAVAGIFWVCYILASKKIGQLIPGTSGLAVALIIGAVAVFPLGATHMGPIFQTPTLLILALGTALLGSLIPYSLELSALRRLPAPIFSILLSLEPAFAAAVGWILLDQTPTAFKWAAIILVIAASIGVTWEPKKMLVDAPLHSKCNAKRRVHTPS